MIGGMREHLLEWGLFERRCWNDINCCDAGAFISWGGGTAGASEEVSRRRNALFRNYGTRMFLLLFWLALFHGQGSWRQNTYQPAGAFLSLFHSFARLLAANQRFSGVRFIPPPRDALVTALTYYTILRRRRIQPAYSIIHIEFFFQISPFPILFISGWQSKSHSDLKLFKFSLVIRHVLFVELNAFVFFFFFFKWYRRLGLELAVRPNKKEKSRGGQLPGRALRPTTPWRL